MSQLDGAFALIFKSRFYPNEVSAAQTATHQTASTPLQLVATRRGSPLLIGISSDQVIHCTLKASCSSRSLSTGGVQILYQATEQAQKPRLVRVDKQSASLCFSLSGKISLFFVECFAYYVVSRVPWTH